MSLFSIIGLYETLQLEGSYRGIGFAYEQGDDEAGRRTLDFMYPGQDITTFQDLGQFDGDIVINGIISGDDYTAQIVRLRAAFQTPGPATLVHPWLGTLQVIQKPKHPPKFTFKSERLRIARFTAVFRRYVLQPPTQPDTLQGLLNSVADMQTAAYAMLASLLAPVALTLTAVSQVEALAGEVAAILGTLVLSCTDPLVGVAGDLPIGLLSTIGSVAYDSTYAGSVGALLSAPTAAIAGTTTPAIPSAVAPGGTTTTPVPVDGRITATLILSAVTQIGTATLTTAPIQIPPGPALILCVQTIMLADAVSAASAIAFDSQQEAMTWRDQVVTATVAAAIAAAGLVPSAPAPASALWRSLIAMKAAWIADMNSEIGRLPPVEIFTPPAAAPVWLYAQYLAGDTPSAIFATWRDLVQRNGIFHPAIPPPGPMEVLA